MRVHEAAKDMGYLPDPMLGALNHYRKTRKHRPILASLAWISPWLPPNDPLDYTEFALYWQGARDTAERHGYHLDKFSPDSRGSFSSLQRVLDARGLNGLLIAPPQSGFHLPIEHIDWARHSSLRFGHALSHIPTHVVTSAQSANAALATDAIHDRGYRRIGFVTTRKATRRTHFLAGFLQAQALRRGPGPVPPLLLPEIDPPSDLRTLSTWLRLHRPDSILTNLRPLRHMLAQLDLAVPRDIALATLSVHDGDADAGIDQNPRVIGETACETLIAMVQQNMRGLPDHPREILIRGRWVDGSSLPAASHRRARL